jgi:hypothetical protein
MKRTASALLFALAAGAAHAQSLAIRSVPIPDTAVRGAVVPAQFPLAAVNGKVVRFAPGARIFGPTNLLVLPTNVPEKAPAAFVFDQMGQIQTMWLLTEEEQKVKRKNF